MLELLAHWQHFRMFWLQSSGRKSNMLVWQIKRREMNKEKYSFTAINYRLKVFVFTETKTLILTKPQPTSKLWCFPGNVYGILMDRPHYMGLSLHGSKTLPLMSLWPLNYSLIWSILDFITFEATNKKI